ncbi:RbsD/FucU family protein [Celeribacter sp.]|uniref:RbsD/FucU family protein n=1 Tax=Celeribacter sp. TaxID=1890673 RepID=UPI003A91588C
MLHNIPAILPPEALLYLAQMGHGDMIVIADSNFPAQTMGKRVIRCEGSNATEILEAVVTLLPLDTFVQDRAVTMQVVGEPDTIPPAVAEFQAIIDAKADNPAPIESIERFAFYDRAREAFAVIQTGEPRPYGNIILTKGIIV